MADDAIASVNGVPISRARVVELLLRSRGGAVVDAQIGLAVAEQAAAEKGISLTQADVDREYAESLRRLADPLVAMSNGDFDLDESERLLNTVLASRGISREEFLVTIRRNAYLRKLVEADRTVSEDALHSEYARRFGRRTRVRHIQLASLSDVTRIRERLEAGAEFGEMAQQFSANRVSGLRGGWLDPFTADNEDVPRPFRQAAFSLAPGAISPAVRVGEWYHLIKLAEVLPADDRDFDTLRDELERSLRRRVTEAEMFERLEQLYRPARIEIHDPIVRAALESAVAKRGRAGP